MCDVNSEREKMYNKMNNSWSGGHAVFQLLTIDENKVSDKLKNIFFFSLFSPARAAYTQFPRTQPHSASVRDSRRREKGITFVWRVLMS